MKRHIARLLDAIRKCRFGALPMVIALGIFGGLLDAGSDDKAASTSSAANAPLKGTEIDGRPYRLGCTRGCTAVVVVFLSAECPISNSSIPQLNRLASDFGTDGVEFYGVISERNITRKAAAEHRDSYRIGFPVLFDASCELRDLLRPTHAPQAFVLTPSGKVVYSGRIDDRHEQPGRRNPEAKQSFVRDALRAILAGRPVVIAATEPVECLLEKRKASSGQTEFTYARDIAPLMQNHCAECHRPGAVAPFPLLSYEQVAKRARQIALATEKRFMPPWKPVAGFGTFKHERRLTDHEVEVVSAWAKAGAPEGNAADLPPTREFPEGWQLGKPNLVFQMPEAFDVPADGPDVYQYFVLSTGLEENRLVSAMEFRSSNARVVHHATIFLDTTGAARRLDDADPAPGYRRAGSLGFAPSGGLGGWGPGATAQRLPRGTGRLIRKGADLVMQVHYHPSGKPERDQSSVGIYFAPAGSQRLVGEVLVANRRLEIPAGAARHRHAASYTLPVDTILFDVTPHMHLLGREIKATATLPDGRLEPLVWVRDWDFDWHDHYAYETPLRLPRGTRIDVTAEYDNSAANPRNPHSPPRTVTWGEQSTEEMGVCFFQVTADRLEDYAKLIEDNGRYVAEQDPLSNAGQVAGAPLEKKEEPER